MNTTETPDASTRDGWIAAFKDGFERGKREYTRVVDERRDDVRETMDDPGSVAAERIDAMQHGFMYARSEWEPLAELPVEQRAVEAYEEYNQ